MTDSLAALTALADKPSMARDEALHTFYERAKANKEALVITSSSTNGSPCRHALGVASRIIARCH